MSDENKLEINQETEEKIENSNNESETNFDIDVGEIKNDSEKLMDNIETLDVDSEIMGVSKEEQEKLEKEFPIDWNEIEYEAANPDIPKITSEDLRILVITKLVSESRSELENSVNLLKDIMKKTKRSLDEKDKKAYENSKKYLARMQTIARKEAIRIISGENIYLVLRNIGYIKLALFISKKTGRKLRNKDYSFE